MSLRQLISASPSSPRINSNNSGGSRHRRLARPDMSSVVGLFVEIKSAVVWGVDVRQIFGNAVVSALG